MGQRFLNGSVQLLPPDLERVQPHATTARSCCATSRRNVNSALYNDLGTWRYVDKASRTVAYGTRRHETVRGDRTHRTAAPEGGARTPLREWVRGCLFTLTVIVAANAAAALDLPSGQSVTLSEVLIDRVEDEDWLRFRFVAPEIARSGGSLGYADAEGDFAVLCDDLARPYMAEQGLSAAVVVISLMDRPVPFGQPDPDATQFFEAYRIEDGACVWQAF
ncbi:MAG: DUF6497 family protein [Pseudomonadota bacterium]